ncbi:MAG: endoglucanase [Solirubrobacteraceae bacterium]|nr:endoglucanase [Solirubrobacteraceae bacterium]
MRRAPRLIALLVLGSLLVPAAAQGRRSSGDFGMSAASYTVHEYSGRAVITVLRGDTRAVGHVAYIAVGMGHPCGASACTATPPDNGDTPADFGYTKGWLKFPRGVARESFSVPILDHHFATVTKTVSVGLFASYPQGRSGHTHAVLRILGDDPVSPRDGANPLQLPRTPPAGDPLRGARFFVDRDAAPARVAHSLPELRAIADQPGVARFGAFSGADIGLAVNRYLVRATAQGPGTVPMLATYELVDGHCGGYTPSRGAVAHYRGFMERMASAIGGHRAVLFLELDALITSGCLSQTGVGVRERELRDAIGILRSHCPHLVIYLDAGAADAIGARRTAQMLGRSGVDRIQGFLLNSTHFDWTSREIRYGERVSRLLGGAHFVINTGTNGRGPLVPADRAREGNEVLCNPPGRGLGPRPSTNTGYLNVDAFAWTTNPGESGGACVAGAPPTGYYWPSYAMMLVRNAVYAVDHSGALRAWEVDH